MRHGLISALLNLIFPEKRETIAARELDQATLETLLRPRLVKEAWITALFPYSDHRIRALIKGTKFYGVEEPLKDIGTLAGEYLLGIISDKRSFAGWNRPLLIPVPSSEKRLRIRGYNQAERLARHIYEPLETAADFATDIVYRDERVSQTKTDRDSRAANVSGTFFIPEPSRVNGRHIIVIDDVVETGSTLKDIRRALLSAGAADVLALAIAQ